MLFHLVSYYANNSYFLWVKPIFLTLKYFLVMEDLLYRFLRLDPAVVKRYSSGERSLLQFYAVIVLIGCMAALGIWCTGLSYLFNTFVAIFGILPALAIWGYDTALLKVSGFRSLIGRFVSGLILSFFTTVCLGAVVYYQTAVHEAEQEAENARLEVREQLRQKVDAYKLEVEKKYKPEIDRTNKYYTAEINKLMLEQRKSARKYSESAIKKAQEENPFQEDAFSSSQDQASYGEPNKAEQYVDTVIQRQIEFLKAQQNAELERIEDRIREDVEKAQEDFYYAPEIKPDLTLGNIWGKITQTAFDEKDRSKLSLTGIIYMICLAFEFFPFIIRVVALSFTTFIKENTD